MNRSEAPYWVDHRTWMCRRHIPAARFPAAADRCLIGCVGVVRPPNQPAPPQPVPEPTVLPTPAPAEAWREFDQAGEVELAAMSLDHLRKYAANVLRIAGASKIPGGKPALVQAILSYRQAA